jgi:putative transposase
MKAMNQLWNKKVATRKEGKSEGYWDNWLDCVTRKHNHQMRDGINKAAKLVINHCLKHGIGNLVIGWNQGFKSNASMGKLNNLKFVQMPLGKLKDRLKQLCDLHGIRFTETEEAYIAVLKKVRYALCPRRPMPTEAYALCPVVPHMRARKAIHLKLVFSMETPCPDWREKPPEWKASGKRIKRGLYRSADGIVINADLNGAANILRKVVSKLGINLNQLNRRCLTTVARVRLWVLPKPTLSAESSVSLDLRVSSIQRQRV